MRLFRGTISTKKTGAVCQFEVEIDDEITDENEVNMFIEEEVFRLIEWECHEIKDDGLVSGRREMIINELRKKYPDVKFGFYEEVGSLQLLHNSLELNDDNFFFAEVCEIAEKYLIEEEKNIFCVLYDYLNQLDEGENS